MARDVFSNYFITQQRTLTITIKIKQILCSKTSRDLHLYILLTINLSMCVFHGYLMSGFKNSLTFLISITALPMKPSHLKKRGGRQVGVNGSKRKKKEREGRESKRRKCLQGKLLKKVQAGWLGSSSKGWIPPLPPLHPNGSCWHHC